MRTRLGAEFSARLRVAAPDYAYIAMANIVREYPARVTGIVHGPGEMLMRPRDRSPVFYGSFDWQSSVQMHWLLIRLLRLVPDRVPSAQIRGLLDSQFTAGKLRAEAAFLASRDGLEQRPMGWGWILALAHELASWPGDRDGMRWARTVNPLAMMLTQQFLGWLSVGLPCRSGSHENSAFGLSRALPYARMLAGGGESELAAAIASAALRWYYSDSAYPAGLEPSASDFLSPALTEAELMAALLPPSDLPRWLSRFLPGLEDEVLGSLLHPTRLPGLNLTRAWCWRRLAQSLPPDDPRVAACEDAALRHAEAGLPHAFSGDYEDMHWLPALAVLLLS